jgi:hypothetical protein
VIKPWWEMSGAFDNYGDKRNAHRVFVEKPEGKTRLARSVRK